MKIIYLDCAMGVAGDMLTAALYELLEEKDRAAFLKAMNSCGLDNVHVQVEPVVKCHLWGTQMKVLISGTEEADAAQASKGAENHRHHSMDEIYQMIESLNLPSAVKDNMVSLYQRIAEAESRVHRMAVTEIHLHEVGMLDAIADIAGVCLALYMLDVGKIVASPVTTGFGRVRCAHGEFPVPAPATALLLENVPVRSGDIEGELCTPTGAALVSHYVSEYGNMPDMTLLRVGYGIGRKDFDTPNCVRALLGETHNTPEENADTGGKGADAYCDEVLEMRCNLDDMTPEDLAFAQEILLEHGALDVFTAAIGMKKSRLGMLLTVLCNPADEEVMTALIFRYTSTIGIRQYHCERRILRRTESYVTTRYGCIRFKDCEGYGVTKSKPEFEDLQEAARKNEISTAALRQKLSKD